MTLVTGGTGLVGAHLLLQLLREGSVVTATYRDDRSLEKVKIVFSYYSDEAEGLFNRIRWVRASVNDLVALEKAFEEVTLVYHCAALISFDPADFKNLRKVNAEGTANIVNTCLARGVDKLCYVSSIATIGSPLNGAPATEEDYGPDNDANVYAISKYAAEMEVWRGAQEGLPVVIVNPGVILGPGFWKHGSGKIFHMAAKVPRYYPPGGTGFVGVADVVQTMVKLMQSTITNERFILIERNCTYKELLALLAAELHHTPPKILLRNWQLELLWRLDWLRNRLTGRKRKLTKNSVQSLKHVIRYDNQKIKASLGYRFKPLEDTIAFSCLRYHEEYHC